MITHLDETITLNNGLTMPGYGFGCYKMTDPTQTETAVRVAVDCGYRMIDTAGFYENEDFVGSGIRASSIAREKLFVVSKIWPTLFEDTPKQLEQSLRLLNTEYLDAFLLHWPGTNKKARLKAFEQLLYAVEKKYIRSVGVSNFLQVHLEELHATFGIWPALNQIEVHPTFNQRALCQFCAEKGIHVVSWAPLGRGNLLNHPTVLQQAARLEKKPAQVLLRWHIEQNLVPIPKSLHAERILENTHVFDFTLDTEATHALDALHIPENAGRTGSDPLTFSGIK